MVTLLIEKSRKKRKVELQITNNFNTHGTPTLISYKPDREIGKTLTDKVNSLHVDIKMKPG